MKAHELLDSPGKLTKGAYARNIYGKVCDVYDPKAECWCMAGAIVRCHGYDASAFEKIRDRIREKTKFRCIESFNDCSSYNEVIEILKEVDI